MRRSLYLAALSMLVVALTANVAFAQDDLNCDDFDSQAEAQQTLREDPSDPNGLDAENDGVACEVTDYPNPERDEVPVEGSVSPGGDLDCEDFATQQEAQAVFNQDTSDPNGLDADNDGLACEDFDYATGGMTGNDVDDDTVGMDDALGMDDDMNGGAVVDQGAGATQYGDDDATATQYADDEVADDNVTALPDTGGPALLPLAAGLAVAGFGGLLLKRRTS